MIGKIILHLLRIYCENYDPKKWLVIVGMYNIYVEDFMVRDVKYIWHGISYQELKNILKENRKLRGFPLVDNPDSMILLGSIQRLQLIKLIEKHIGRERRLQVMKFSTSRKNLCELSFHIILHFISLTFIVDLF